MSDYMVSPPSLVQRTHSGATALVRNYLAGGVASTVQATSRVMEQLLYSLIIVAFCSNLTERLIEQVQVP